MDLNINKTFIVDFDHTIFNWNGFKRDLIEELGLCGISEEIFNESQIAHQKRDGFYNVYIQLKDLSKLTNTEFNELVSKFEKLAEDMEKYIFPDALEFLKRMYDHKKTAVLLTRGDKENQEKFIFGSKVDKYFDQIVIVPNKDAKIEKVKIKKSDMNETVIIVNDDPEEALKMAPILLPGSKSYLVERPGAKFPQIEPNENYIVIKNLMEIF